LALSTKRLVAATKFLVAATKILFVVPNFVAVTKPFFLLIQSQNRTANSLQCFGFDWKLVDMYLPKSFECYHPMLLVCSMAGVATILDSHCAALVYPFRLICYMLRFL